MSITLAVQEALVARMLADATLSALISGRVYEDVPSDDAAFQVAHPYVSLGPEDWTDPMAECLDGENGVVQIDIWSRAPGRAECKTITDRIAGMFRDTDLALPAPYRCTSVGLILRRILQDPDGLTMHGVVQLRILTEEVG